MGKWESGQYGKIVEEETGAFLCRANNNEEAICGVYNALWAAYAAISAERDEWKDKERVTSELFEAACNDLGAAQERIAALEGE